MGNKNSCEYQQLLPYLSESDILGYIKKNPTQKDNFYIYTGTSNTKVSAIHALSELIKRRYLWTQPPPIEYDTNRDIYSFETIEFDGQTYRNTIFIKYVKAKNSYYEAHIYMKRKET